MAILAKTQKWYEGKSERGGVQQPPLLRERADSANFISIGMELGRQLVKPFLTLFLFFNLETSLIFSSLIGEIFVKAQKFDSYDVIMM